ncbi:hypothetical protein F4677DRAFT_441860 [Hypoxylon crocopeplum]|nr:hypothetical protein F4677DRAFT_441860 [Hypoxylon crocopeplum]
MAYRTRLQSPSPPPPYVEEDPNPPYNRIDRNPQLLPPYTVGTGVATRGIDTVMAMIPVSLNEYRNHGFLRTLHLGEHANEPLFNVIAPYKIVSIAIRSASSNDSLILATATRMDWSDFPIDSVIDIQASTSGPAGQQLQQPQDLKVSMEKDADGRYTFTMDVGFGNRISRETFQWRPNSVAQGQGLDQTARGYNLVRLDNRYQHGPLRRDDGFTNEVFKFNIASRAARGYLGSKFAMVALMSALKIWYFMNAPVGGV